MTDLVERLRTHFDRTDVTGLYVTSREALELCVEAADELERLRDVIRSLRRTEGKPSKAWREQTNVLLYGEVTK